MAQLLDVEMEIYEQHRDELLGKFEGKYVLIYEQAIAGVFDTKGDAIREGYQRFGNVPFLVKQILKVETPQNFISGLLAI